MNRQLLNALIASASATPAQAGVAPFKITSPSIAAAVQGAAVSYSSGTVGGTPTPTFGGRQWYEDSAGSPGVFTAVAGAVGATYPAPQAGEVGRGLQVWETYSNGVGSPIVIKSNTVTIGSSAPSGLTKMIVGVNYSGDQGGDTYTNKAQTYYSALDSSGNPNTSTVVVQPTWQTTPTSNASSTVALDYVMTFNAATCTGVSTTFNDTTITSGPTISGGVCTVGIHANVGASSNNVLTLTGVTRAGGAPGCTGIDIRLAADVGVTTCYSPRYLSYLAPFGLIRLMNYCGANSDYTTTTFASWNPTLPKTIAAAAKDTPSRIHWVCIPIRATADFDNGLVNYFKTNAPAGNFAFQIGNEIWNGALKCFHFILNPVCEDINGCYAGSSHIYTIQSGSIASNVLTFQVGFDPTTKYTVGQQLLVTNLAGNVSTPNSFTSSGGDLVRVTSVTASNATFTGSTDSSGVLTATGVTGTIKVGQLVTYTGAPIYQYNSLRIAGQTSGTTGGAGVYTLSGDVLPQGLTGVSMTTTSGTLVLTPVSATFPNSGNALYGGNTGLWDPSLSTFSTLSPANWYPASSILDCANRYQIRRTWQFEQRCRAIVGDAAMQTQYRTILGAQVNNTGADDLSYLSALVGSRDVSATVWAYACAPYWNFDGRQGGGQNYDLIQASPVYTTDQYADSLVRCMDNAWSYNNNNYGGQWFLEERAFNCVTHGILPISYEGGPTAEDCGYNGVNTGYKNAAKQTALHVAGVGRVLDRFEASGMRCFSQFTDSLVDTNDPHFQSYGFDSQMGGTPSPFHQALINKATSSTVASPKIRVPAATAVTVPGTIYSVGAFADNSAQGGFTVANTVNAGWNTLPYPQANQIKALVWFDTAGPKTIDITYGATNASGFTVQINGVDQGVTASYNSTGSLTTSAVLPTLHITAVSGWNAILFAATGGHSSTDFNILQAVLTSP